MVVDDAVCVVGTVLVADLLGLLLFATVVIVKTSAWCAILIVFWADLMAVFEDAKALVISGVVSVDGTVTVARTLFAASIAVFAAVIFVLVSANCANAAVTFTPAFCIFSMREFVLSAKFSVAVIVAVNCCNALSSCPVIRVDRRFLLASCLAFMASLRFFCSIFDALTFS